MIGDNALTAFEKYVVNWDNFNPDDSEQRAVFGIPEALDTPDDYRPTPWERYHCSPNDLATSTPLGDQVPQSSRWTPKSETIDPLGNVIRTTEHKAHYNPTTEAYEDVVMKYQYDIKGQLIKAIDPYDRDISVNHYTIADQIGDQVADQAVGMAKGMMLRTDHLDLRSHHTVFHCINKIISLHKTILHFVCLYINCLYILNQKTKTTWKRQTPKQNG